MIPVLRHDVWGDGLDDVVAQFVSEGHTFVVRDTANYYRLYDCGIWLTWTQDWPDWTTDSSDWITLRPRR